MTDPDDPTAPAAKPPTRSIEASRRLSQLLARPLGSPAPPEETPEPYVPRSVRAAPPAAAPGPPHDTASAAHPPPVASDEPDLPWFDPPVRPKPDVEPAPASAPKPPEADAETAVPSTAAPVAPAEAYEAEPAGEDDLFERREPPRDLDEPVSSPAPDPVPEWARPSALDRVSEPAAEPRPALGAPPEPLVALEPPRPAPVEPARVAPAAAARPLDPDATRALGNIRRLMLFSNLFMVVAIGAVLTVVGYRLFRTEPAPPPPPPTPPPAPKPALATIPNDMTLTLPRDARIVQTAVAGDRLVVTLEIDGATEIRTFDIKTLKPIGRLMFDIVP
jgi:hypothetical protein